MTDAHLLRLMTWLSPAFPTGGFAYSSGLEWAVEAGDVRDGVSLLVWVRALATHGALAQDAALLRHAHRADTAHALLAVADIARALSPARERHAETVAQGSAFALGARVWGTGLLAAVDAPTYPVAVGAVARAHGVGEDAACVGYLHAAAANAVHAAVRLVPLGQTSGLRVLAALEEALSAAAAGSREATLDDLGTACFAADIAQMRHETQRTRLFRS